MTKKTAKKKTGRPPKPPGSHFKNPQVQFGRHPKEEIELIDSAARSLGLTRSDFAWPVLIEKAKEVLTSQGKGS